MGKCIAGFVLLVFAAIGVAVLFPELGVVWKIVVIAVLVAVAAIRFLSAPSVVKLAGVVLGALVIPVFALLGVDSVMAHLGIGRLDPTPSLIVGAVIVFAAAGAYLRSWWVTEEVPLAPLWAVVVVLALAVAPVLAVLAIGRVNGDGSQLAQRDPVSQLDVIVLRADGGTQDIVEDYLRGWRIHIWTGTVEGSRVAWGAGGTPPVVPRPDADRVLLLLPAAKPAADEVSNFLGVADEVEARATPTYAVIDTTDGARLQRWRDALSHARGREGGALALRSGGRAQTVTELALRAAVLAPTADEDLALAVAHRPALFFDSRERYPHPLDVDQLLGSGQIKMCKPGQRLRSLCSEVHRAGDLSTGFNHLAFDSGKLAKAKVASTIYVNVTRSGNDARNAIYLDYWWYFPYNPAESGGGAFCGAGLDIGEVTCFDHQSDWEGVTVVLDGDRPAAPPLAVDYAQHNKVARYTWPALQRLWGLGDRRRFGSGVDTDQRPLVFVARGTHASYPRSCATDQCTPNPVPRVHDDSSFDDNRHDGGLPWSGNVGLGCTPACVTALPTHRSGTEAASWNAWGGVWGTANCVIAVVCSSSQPPRSPGAQGRYLHPWCVSETFDLTGARFTERTRGCPSRKSSADELTHGERLLALGDSYSSGEGAGDYDPDTDTKTNSCHRSQNAWPQVLAHMRGLVALPSLACSGALMGDLLTGRKEDEPERRKSQIGRIEGDPSVITLTVGGNDTGFASVLKSCVFSDCIAKYHTPKGDLLDRKIATVARRLPDVYEAIRRAAPRARLVVVDYPRIFPQSDAKHPLGNCSAARQISTAEADYLNDKSKALDAAIVSIAKKLSIDVIDVSDAFAGRELRCSGPTYMNRLNLAKRLFSASFHPNASGHERLARVVSERLAALDSSAP